MSETVAITLAALGGELLLLLMGLLTVSFLRNRAARRRDHAAIEALLARVKRGKPEREQAIEQFLSSGMGLTGETLTEAKVGMLRAELVLLQRFAGIYKKHEATAASQFDGDLYAALAPYHALTAGGVVIEPGVENDPDTAELELLRTQNARMAEELRITMETMSRMLNEYSTMFAGAAPDNAAPIGAIAGAAGAVAHRGEADGAPDAPRQRMDAPPGMVAEQDESGFEADPTSHAPAAQGESARDLSDVVAVDDTAADVVTAHAAEDTSAAPQQAQAQRDADQRDRPLEEGAVEVVAFDELAEAGVGQDDLTDDLFDALARQAPEGQAAQQGDDEAETGPDDAGLKGMFDAGDEPLRTRSGS